MYIMLSIQPEKGQFSWKSQHEVSNLSKCKTPVYKSRDINVIFCYTGLICRLIWWPGTIFAYLRDRDRRIPACISVWKLSNTARGQLLMKSPYAFKWCISRNKYLISDLIIIIIIIIHFFSKTLHANKLPSLLAGLNNIANNIVFHILYIKEQINTDCWSWGDWLLIQTVMYFSVNQTCGLST